MSPIITCMSRVTKHVGFGLTYASTFMHPFYVARLFNSLDHVTNGRIAFNVIASSRNAEHQKDVQRPRDALQQVHRLPPGSDRSDRSDRAWPLGGDRG